MHTILYIGKHYISENKFVTEQGLGALENFKKIGVTGKGNADIFSREQGLSDTKSPVKWVALRAWKIKGINAEKLEKAVFHNLLESLRVEGEWFFDEDGTMISKVQRVLETLNLIDGFSFEKIPLEKEDKSAENNAVRDTEESVIMMVENLRSLMDEKVGHRVGSSSVGGNAYSVFYTDIRGRDVEVVSVAPKNGTISFKLAIIGKMSDIDNQIFCRQLMEDFVKDNSGYVIEKSGSNVKITLQSLEEFSKLLDEFLIFIKNNK